MQVPSIDIDVALLCVSRASQIDEMLQLLYRHRHSPRTVRVLPSTHDTAIRACVALNRADAAVTMLTDTVGVLF